MTGDPRRSSGFTLIELLVSLAVMAIVSSQVLLAFSSQHRSYVEQEQVIDTQQDVRMIADVIVSDLRMAGYMLDDGLAAGSIDGGNAGSDLLCVSDPEAISNNIAVDAVERLPGADVATNVTAGNTSVTLSSGEKDIDGDGTDDFSTTNGGILITDGNRVHCGRITGISDEVISFAPPVQSGISMSQFEAFAVPALVYEVVNDRLLRNGQVISTQVEDLQVRFGIDDNDDDAITGAEFPIDVLGTTHDLGQMRIAQIHLTSRNARPQFDFAGQRTAAANRVAGGNDNFKRRKVTADVTLRNAR